MRNAFLLLEYWSALVRHKHRGQTLQISEQVRAIAAEDASPYDLYWKRLRLLRAETSPRIFLTPVRKLGQSISAPWSEKIVLSARELRRRATESKNLSKQEKLASILCSFKRCKLGERHRHWASNVWGGGGGGDTLYAGHEGCQCRFCQKISRSSLRLDPGEVCRAERSFACTFLVTSSIGISIPQRTSLCGLC